MSICSLADFYQHRANKYLAVECGLETYDCSYREITMVFLKAILVLHMMMSPVLPTKINEPCPAAPPCDCDGYSINCDSRNLTQVPYFSKSSYRRWEVDLRSNRLTSIPSHAFENITMYMLQLSHNMISEFADDSLQGSEDTLEFLFMQFNRMDELPTAIGKMNNLSSLSIHDNPLVFLEEDVFKNLSHCLTFLAIGSPEMTSWPMSLRYLRSLDTLDLYEASFNSIPEDAFVGLENSLASLTFESTNLTSIPLALNQLRNLEVFALWGNPSLTLRGIPADVFKGLNRVDMLSIMNSTFEAMPDISQLVNLRMLDVSSTPMKQWPRSNLPEQPILQQIQFDGVSFEKVPDAVSKINSMRFLRLSHSNISSLLSNDFLGLQKLEILDFWGSPLKTISNDAFKDNYSLTQLRLDNTNVTAIPQAVKDLPTLHYVSLDGDIINCTCASMGWLKNRTGPVYLNIEGSCHNLKGMWISDYMQKELPKCL